MFSNTPLAEDGVPSGPTDMSLDKAELVAVFLECLLYGIEALTFVATVYLLHGAMRTKTMVFQFGLVIIMFMLNTIHIGAVFRRTLNAFVGTVNDPVPDASAYLADLAGFLYRFMNIITVIQFVMLDTLVVYRCYMIWDKKFVVTIVPSLSVSAFLVAGVGAIRAFATDTTDTVFTGRTRTWVSALLCLTLFTKFVCFAIVLAGTLLPRPTSSWHSVYLRATRHINLYKALLVGIESGGLAVLGAVILIPVYLAGRNAQGIMLAAMSPMTGQSFLIIIMSTLLGLTPSNSGGSRRRRFGGHTDHRLSMPPISPSSRFSTGSFKPKFSFISSPTSPVDSKHRGKSFFNFGSKTAEPALAYTDSRYSRGYVRGEPMPFSTAFVQPQLNGSHETIPSGDGDSIHISVSSRQEVNTAPELSELTEPGTFTLARGADGVVVLQKEYVS